ncbi:hypothetical protein T4E_7671 [Trichinella pseudospiralis]|uniref:Uncharacterized protein n=1 Tax=Trichinella pseudospiralis TaxID=6337 RepID=A0A0V0YBU6_TRIPS|nr:hypothetical protein T4E_7671 [Trichinella pseudospiralis]
MDKDVKSVALLQSRGDRDSKRETVSFVMMLNVNLLSGFVFSPMIDIRFAVTPLTSSFGVAPFISLGIIH